MSGLTEELERSFVALIDSIGHTLHEHGVPWMLVGGLAVGVWTEPRATKDCDIAIALPPDVAPLESALRSLGLDSSRGDLERASHGGVVRCRFEPDPDLAMVVDLLCSGTPFEAEALGRRRAARVFGVDTFVVSPDDLLIYKLVAGRPQDMADVDKLIRFGRAPEDEAYVGRWVREWEVEDRLEQARVTASR